MGIGYFMEKKQKVKGRKNDKPLSLYPLPFEEALAALLKAKPVHKKKKKKKRVNLAGRVGFEPTKDIQPVNTLN